VLGGGLFQLPGVIGIGGLMVFGLNHEPVPLDATLQEAGHALVNADAEAVAQAVQVRMTGSDGYDADEMILVGEDWAAGTPSFEVVGVELDLCRMVPNLEFRPVTGFPVRSEKVSMDLC
jgi:hypothetical protein